jgi:hypothetical protein
MIAIKLMGGLGNQLFQIFATIAYGLEHNIPFVFVYSKMLNERKTYWEDFLLGIKKYTNVASSSFQLGFLKSTQMISSYPVFEESGFTYEPIPFNGNNLCLSGYFQSYKYFQRHENTIFSLIQLREQQYATKNEFSRYFPTNVVTISLHFRLGDYKVKQQYHPIMPFEYYAKAIQEITLKIDQPLLFLYFCEQEDNDTVKKIIGRLQNIYRMSSFVKVDDSIVDWKQLLIMSCCNHQIIANSSFSWFSAYLNDNPNKIVCFPSLWFGPGLAHHNLKDLFPESWKKIDL